MMTEALFRQLLQNLLESEAGWAEFGDELHVRSFADAMLMTNDEGLVVRLEGGEEFQVTVRRSR